MTRAGIILIASLTATQLTTLRFTSDADAAKTLKLSSDDVALLRQSGVLATVAPKRPIPQAFGDHPVPQSVAEDAEARSSLRREGLRELDIEIGETVGAFQAEGDGFWFGKSFYAAEGDSGTGAIGFLSGKGDYSFLTIPEIQRASVSALEVTDSTILAGLVHRGERGVRSLGLLEYDRKTRRAITHAVTAAVHTIRRLANGIFVGTTDGPYLVRRGEIIRLDWR